MLDQHFQYYLSAESLIALVERMRTGICVVSMLDTRTDKLARHQNQLKHTLHYWIENITMLFVQRKHGPGPCELVRKPHRRKRFLTWFPYVILLLGVGLRLAEAEVETNGGSHGFKAPSGAAERVSNPGPVGMLLVWKYQLLKLLISCFIHLLFNSRVRVEVGLN